MSTKHSIRILIADDHPVVREGMAAMLSNIPDLELVGAAEDGVEAVEMARTLRPDVILLDLVMPRKGGLEAIHDIKEENPAAKILVVTSFTEDDKVFPAIKSGALGYLLKDAPPELLLQAIRDVYQGESSLHPTIARKLIQEISQPSPLPPTETPLTEREIAVLRLIARGLTDQDIAHNLSITIRTVRFHVSNILSKLHVANRTQAALYALQEGLSDLENLDNARL
ncbi:MAG: response regulator transcription factor [Anaerolineae bacterium]|nr:response regulator transcription factor [Anaerolineae bacterium]